MTLILRGLLALGLPTLFTTFALADAPAAGKATASASSKTTPATASTANGCTTCAPESKGLFGRTRHLKSGRLIAANEGGRILRPVGEDRVGQAADRYLAANDRIGAFFERLAGPPVDPAPGGLGKKDRGPTTQPGTVVFPQHPFARSPRDFFMQD